MSKVYLKDYKSPDYFVEAIRLEFQLGRDVTQVTNTMKVRRALDATSDAPFVLNGEKLSLLGIGLDGEELVERQDYTLSADGLTILAPPAAFELCVETEVRPSENESGHGLFTAGQSLATQCEAEGFRRITYFPDRPDILSVYTVYIEASEEEFPVLLSNGDKVHTGALDGGRHFAVWIDPHPKPCYIFALAAGRFECLQDAHVTKSGRSVELGVYADAGEIEHCSFAMNALKKALLWEEQTYGLEYDLGTYNIVALSGYVGAMENKGLNFFELGGVVANPETATDQDYLLIERITGHEVLHNWSGNRVTCRDWFQLSLKEGLTRFRDQSFARDMLQSDIVRIDVVKALRRNQFPEDDGPAAHPIKPKVYADIDNFYTTTVYDKGAEVIRMMYALIGEEAFHKGLALYFERHDLQAVTTEAFVKALEDGSGRDLTQFREWYDQPGRPVVSAMGAYDADRHVYTLTLTQENPKVASGAPLPMPVTVGLLSKTGAPLTFSVAGAGGEAQEAAVLEFTERRQTFDLEGVTEPPIPSLLRRFSAPVSLTHDLTDEDLAVQMAFDADPYARWNASQELGVRLIRRLAKDYREGGALRLPAFYVDAFETALADEAGDKLLRAEILTIPDEPALSDGLSTIDLDAHMAAREFIRAGVADRLSKELRRGYDHYKNDAFFSSDISEVGMRRLQNKCLEYLMISGAPDALNLCLDQLKTSKNMTNAFEALTFLVNLGVPQAEDGVAWFYDRWKTDDGVVNKWFNAQALSRAPKAIDRILALPAHEAFDMKNIARGMAFFGGFFRQNRVVFHDISGKGYEFLADCLLTIDKTGRSGSHWLMPQINQWRRYDAERQSMMKAALERVAGEPALSAGLRENIERALS